MKQPSINSNRTAAWPRWWRWTVIALGTLTLCSCRAPHAVPPGPHAPEMLPPGAGYGDAAFATPPAMMPPATVQAPATPMPMAETIVGPWAPPGIAAPWPPDEYLCDGGDKHLPVQVMPDWHVHGLEPEDTIVHYDTVDGLTVVEASNRVCLYAPRFGAVRSVTGLVEKEQVQVTHGVELPVNLVGHGLAQGPMSSMQKDQLLGQIGSKRASTYRMRTGDGALSLAILPGSFQDFFLPFEDFSAIRQGIYVEAEKARLSQAIQSAIVWTHDQAVQVVLDGVEAGIVTGDQRAEAVFIVEPPKNDKLRVIKVASTPVAQPGDFVDFTIRFDNLGERPIGNVTIIDNLTTRLEFVPDSAQASLKGNFFTQTNEAGSLVLRWEVEEPLPPGQGGVVRFRCRVR